MTSLSSGELQQQPSARRALRRDRVARALGHVDTSMVYRTYGRYIPNLTKQNGQTFENRFTGVETKKMGKIVTIVVTIADILPTKLS